MTDPSKLALSDVEGLEALAKAVELMNMTKAPYEHTHRFDDIEDHSHLLNTLYTTLASANHTHATADIEGFSRVVDAVGRLETKVSELANRPPQVIQSNNNQPVQQQAPQIIKQYITQPPVESKFSGKMSYRDIVDLTELFDVIKKRSQPRLTVVAEEPEEDRVLHIVTTIVNPMGYCLTKAKLELIDLTSNTVLSTVKYMDLESESFVLTVLVPELTSFKGIVRLIDPMNTDLNVTEHVRISR